MSELRDRQYLVKLLENNYSCLHRQYRLGGFEHKVGYRRRWLPAGPESDEGFYEVCEGQQVTGGSQPGAQHITFKSAIENLNDLICYVGRCNRDVAITQAVLLLRCRCLIYEASDYWLNVSAELGSYFINRAEAFPHHPEEFQPQAEAFDSTESIVKKDDRAKVIKVQLIAALCGANELYRRHGASDYGRALSLLEKLRRFIVDELPLHHEVARPSFGLIGLVEYLIGRVLSGQGAVRESRQAFRRSAEAYVARLRQKEEFLRDESITPQEYEEKISVTLRRTALVTAFGDGYLSFASGHITRALESLTLARAALSRNAGRVYINYVDMLFWACHRAAYSSDKQKMDLVVQELRKCRETFNNLVKGSHYFHRAGLQLALALYYRAKLSSATAGEDYDEGIRYANEAVKFAGKREMDRPKNPHLLAAALVTRSRFLSSRYRPGNNADTTTNLRYLAEAEADAIKARDVSAGIRDIHSEALATLGDVYTDLAELHRANNKKFYTYFDRSLEALEQALQENQGENIRTDAVCYLRLTKLCLLNPNTDVSAHEYFERWKNIEAEVENDYCKTLASELLKKGNLRGPVLLIEVKDSLNYDEWSKTLSSLLLEEALKKFVERHKGEEHKQPKWRSMLATHLSQELGYARSKVYQMIGKEKLMEVIKSRMSERSTEAPG